MHKDSIRFDNINENHHKCYVEKEGDWLVFRCPLCHEYERRINLKTRESKLIADFDNFIPHYGYFIKPGLDTGLYQPN